MNPPRLPGNRRPASCLGAGLFLLVVGVVGCGPSSEPPPDPELEAARELGLQEGARLHRVLLGGRGAEEHVLPGRIRAASGDGVEFVTVDHRVHTIEFPRDSLSAEADAFLASTGQEGSPPLLYRGSRFILLLKGAPAGRYPFISQGNGGVAAGVVLVTLQRDSLALGHS